MRGFYFEATHYLNGEHNGCWTSEIPGRTGPALPWHWWLRLWLSRNNWRVRLRRRAAAVL